MKTIFVQLKGNTPLLMNSPKGMLEDDSKSLSKKTEKRDWNVEAEKVSYRTKDGFLYVPSTAIKGCLINASSYKKIGKYSARPIIAGGVMVFPDEIKIKDLKCKDIKDYEIDLRTVVIQRARVLKARPKIIDWILEFEIKINENLIADVDIVKTILEEAGERVGILDYSPRKTGNFGTFSVTKFKEK